jgi:iron complex transport system substrate-binding protein
LTKYPATFARLIENHVNMKELRLLSVFFTAIMVLPLVFSCRQGATKKAPDVTAGKGLSPISRVKYAHGFTIDYYDQYKEIKILNRAGDKMDTLDYLLMREGASVPPDHPQAQVIRIPVKSLVVMSSMHIAQAGFAGVADRITGLGTGQYVNSPLVREGLRTGRIRQVGIDANVNNELVIAMHPGVVMTMSNPDAAFGQYKTLIDAGIPVLPNAEWLETTPLGRAEWVKLVGALTDQEDRVNRKFDSVAQAYQQLAGMGSGASVKPSVIIGMPFKGTWYTPAGESYMAQFLRDAGASYHWSNSKGTGSLALSFESVAPEALTADFWLNVGYVDSKKDVLSKDTRFSSFHAFRTGAVYNNNKRTNDIGSNDYWESGAVNPQLVLADLIRILHPGLLPADSLVYYKQLK